MFNLMNRVNAACGHWFIAVDPPAPLDYADYLYLTVYVLGAILNLVT